MNAILNLKGVQEKMSQAGSERFSNEVHIQLMEITYGKGARQAQEDFLFDFVFNYKDFNRKGARQAHRGFLLNSIVD